MTKKIIVMGGSGVGMIASSIIDKIPDFELIGFINDFVPNGTKIGKYKKIPVIGRTDDLIDLISDEDTYVFNGIVGMTKEKEVYEKLMSLNIPRDKFINIIDPTAIIPFDYCSIGKGVLFSPLCQLSTDTTISDNCILLPNSFVGHNTFLDRYASLATNAVVGANVHIGKAVHVGSNATIREKVKIGDYSLVGMGAAVLEDVPEHSIVVGNPAKVLRHK